MEVDYHFVHEKVLRHDLQVKYIATGDQLVDVFTKSVSTSHFLFLRSKIMVSIDPMVLKGGVKENTETGKQRLKLEEEEDEEEDQRLVQYGVIVLNVPLKL